MTNLMIAHHSVFHGILDDIAVVLGIIVAAIVVFKWPLRKVRERYKDHTLARKLVFGAIPAVEEQMAALGLQLEALMMEMRPNGGTSLRDVANCIEGAVQYHSQAMRAWWNGNPMPMFETDHESVVTWANRALYEAAGLEQDEFVGTKGGWGLVSQSETAAIWPIAEKAIEDAVPFEVTFHLAKTGKLVRWECSPLRAPGSAPGERLGYLSVGRLVEGEEAT